MIATATKLTAAPHNCWDPRTWNQAPAHSKPTQPSPKPSSGGLTDLNNALVQNLVKRTVQHYFRGFVPPRPTSAPMNPERFQHVDVTPKFLMGADYQAYNINGELMVKVSAVTQNPAKATWYDLGKVPAADVVSPTARDSFTPAGR
jgi:hypothetical protein